MYEGNKISVVLGTYKEKNSIKSVLNEYYQTNFVDEIIVVSNNAEEGTDDEITKSLPFKAHKLSLIYEPRQGYGNAYRKAIQSANGDYIVITEADDTFKASDLERFLVYARDFDVVLGTRTSQISSFSGKGMGIMRKFANVIEAKTIEILFNCVALTDVGCTYKLIKRKALKKIMPIWGDDSSPLFNTQLTLLTVALKLRFVEIPITYNKRVGVSSIVGKKYQIIKWAFIIQFYILYFWVNSKLNPQKYK